MNMDAEKKRLRNPSLTSLIRAGDIGRVANNAQKAMGAGNASEAFRRTEELVSRLSGALRIATALRSELLDSLRRNGRAEPTTDSGHDLQKSESH